MIPVTLETATKLLAPGGEPVITHIYTAGGSDDSISDRIIVTSGQPSEGEKPLNPPVYTSQRIILDPEPL